MPGLRSTAGATGAILMLVTVGCSWSRPASTETQLSRLLAQVRTAASAASAPGYDRACGPGHGCVFGAAKSDDHAGPAGHNGCDGFNDLARALMNDVVPVAGCVVTSGEWTDPYTGHVARYVRGQGQAPTIEHVVALRTAWDRGASAWSTQRRIDFANDHELNLLLVSGPVNASKADRSPGQWLPPLPAARCSFVARYLQVSLRWDLPISVADRAAIAALEPTCTSQDWPCWPSARRSC